MMSVVLYSQGEWRAGRGGCGGCGGMRPPGQQHGGHGGPPGALPAAARAGRALATRSARYVIRSPCGTERCTYQYTRTAAK